jgi:hypothetical protein
MKKSKVLDILENNYNYEISEHVVHSYLDIERKFSLQKWKASELDAGHFVEAVRRVLEFELFGSYTPFSDSLEPFHDGVLSKYEQATGNHDSYRMLIPRTLKAIYNIRNKRGVGHISEVSPNEMDSSFILHSSKWILAELVRLNSSMTISKTKAIVNKIVERSIDLLWKYGDVTRILDTNIVTRDKTLVLLYDDSPKSDSELRSIVEYKNRTNFESILNNLHSRRLIEYKGSGECHISPKGVEKAEEIIEESEYGT